MLDITKPVQTRDGRKAEILKSNLRAGRYAILAVIDLPNGNQSAFYFQKDGTGSILSETDLVNVPTKREGFVNIYRHQLFDTQDQADRNAGTSRVLCVHVGWEET